MSEPTKRVIPGCTHSLTRMQEWADQGACPICLTADKGMLQAHLAALALRWSTEKPNKPGYYWHRNWPDEKPTVEQIDLTPDGLKAFDCNDCAYVELWPGEWAGPISPPLEAPQ